MRYLLLCCVLTLAGCNPQAPAPPTPNGQPAPNPAIAPEVPERLQRTASLPLPQLALDLVTDSEVSASSTEGHGYYDRNYQAATRPDDASSGPTVGVGVDLGQQEADYTTSTWTPYIDADSVRRFAACAGHYGYSASSLTKGLSDIKIPWTIALPEFIEQETPAYMAKCSHYYPGYDDLHNNAQGAIFSLSYNRGFSFAGQSRSEMRAIRADVPLKDYDDMASQTRHMERLWRGTSEGRGLCDRREKEATLLETP